MKPRSLRLGEILEQRGRVAHEQTLRALRNQKVLGGRLGTCLLEIDAVSEDELLAALSEIHGVPAATAEDLRNVPPEVLALIPQKVALRCLAVPFYASGSNVRVALANARDLAIQDEINFVVGRRARWYVASDLRIHEALDRYYGGDLPARFIKLLDRLNRARFMWGREAGEPPGVETLAVPSWELTAMGGPPPAASPIPEPPATGPAPSGTVVEAPSTVGADVLAPPPLETPVEAPSYAPATTPVETPVAIPAAASAAASTAAPAAQPTPALADTSAAGLAASSMADSFGTPKPPSASAPTATAVASPETASAGAPGVALDTPPEPPGDDDTQDLVATGRRRGPLALADAEQFLLDPKDRDDVARTLLEFSQTRVRRAVMLVVRKQEIAAWVWSGEGLDGPRLAAWRAGLEEQTIFLALHKGADYFRGGLPPVPAHRELLAAFQPATASNDLVAIPLRVRGRLVAALLVEPLDGRLPDDLFAELRRIAAKAAIAFELCIMRAKLKKA